MASIWLIMYACIPPRSFKETNRPRPGEAEGKVAVVYSLQYHINFLGLEKLHPHPQKYGDIFLRLNTDGWLRPEDFFVPEPVTREQILLAHSERFLKSLGDSQQVARYIEMTPIRNVPPALVDAGLLRAFRYQSGGTLLAARLALNHGIGINLGGGFHHARRDRGEGFCIYNDLAIAIRVLQKEGAVERVLVVDLDVHQGNGTAEIFAADDDVFTFSMHQGNIYPVPKAKSDLDIELAAGCGDEEYLRQLKKALPVVFEKARPQIVFFQAGADTLAADPLGGLNMTPAGLVERDAAVIDRCVENNIPVVTTLGGGYAEDSWKAQYESIRRTLEQYGARFPGHAPRTPTLKEKGFTK